MMQEHAQQQRRGRMRLPVWAAVCVFLGVAVFFFWAEHKAHIMGALPYVLVLLCVAFSSCTGGTAAMAAAWGRKEDRP